MAGLSPIPPIILDQVVLAQFGARWLANNHALSRTPPNSSMQLGQVFDAAVATAFKTMVGATGISVASANSLLPAGPNVVETGPFRVVGGVRPQNFDVGYRPDGVRFAYDSKTLNDLSSVRKNYQNMINDLATEATTVHTRFPYAVVGFLIAIPEPCLIGAQQGALIGTLERLTGRSGVDDPPHLAEAIALVVWVPETGAVSQVLPSQASPLRIEGFAAQIGETYVARYKGLPPHVTEIDAPNDDP